MLTKKTGMIERKLDKQVKVEQRQAPKVDNEIKNLRTKLQHTTKKYEQEYNKLIELAAKRKEIKERETNLMEKETKTIIRAKQNGIDFENPAAMA